MPDPSRKQLEAQAEAAARAARVRRLPRRPVARHAPLPPSYAELHCLSHFSFQCGASSPQELVHRAWALGYAALLVLAAPGVPVREYTHTMLDLMAADPNYGPGYRSAVLANLVSEEDNVRQVAAKVALGEADAGVVYSSDVTPDIAAKVVRIDVPDEYNTLAEYPIARVTGSADPQLGWQFIRFVRSTAGQAILAKWGFILA